MICPKCGNQVSERKNHCDTCGVELSLYRKIWQQSAHYYNRGLECAKVRDLSGAAVLLKRSLELNKRNTDARNLLGLVYYEIGETVAAFREWIFSKHYQPMDNPADAYLEMANADSVKLHTMNQAFQKYNLALESAQQGTDDLAVIQLKKVVGMHPNFIKAMLLLALLHMKANELERASRLLKRVLKIDRSNTTALRYLAEVEHSINSGVPMNSEEPESPLDVFTGGPSPAFEEERFHEDKPNVMAFVGLLAGILIGIAVVFFLIVPGREAGIREEYMAQEKDYSESLNSKLAQIRALETKIATLELNNEELTRNLAEAATKVEYVSYENPEHMQLFTDLFEAVDVYIDYLADRQIKSEKGQNPDEALCIKVANELIEVDISITKDEQAKQYYQKMCDNVLPDAASYKYQYGREDFDKGYYEDAIADLTEAHRYDADYDRPMYYLGRSYEELGNREQAIFYFDLLLKTCPDSSLAGYASERLINLR